MIRAIVAVDNNWAIGKQGGLLFKLKEDLKNFKLKTISTVIVMGENTLLSFPKSKPLKDRINVVLCPEGHEYKGCICYHNFDDLVKDLKIISEYHTVYIIGGGMMYKSMLPYCDRIIVTKVDAEDKDATVFFPNLDNNKSFKVLSTSDIILDNEYNTRYVVYDRIKEDL